MKNQYGYNVRDGKYESAPAKETAFAAVTPTMVLEGDGNRFAVVVSVLWAGIIDSSTTLEIRAGAGSNAPLLCVLDMSTRTKVMTVEQWGDLITLPLFANAVTTGATVSAFGVRWIPNGE